MQCDRQGADALSKSPFHQMLSAMQMPAGLLSLKQAFCCALWAFLSLQVAQQVDSPPSRPAAWLQVLERQVGSLQAAQAAAQGELAASQKRAADLESQVTSLIGGPPVLRHSALATASKPRPASAISLVD